MQKTVTDIQFETMLKHTGLSMTAPRRSVFDVLKNSHSPLTIKEIVDRIPNVHYVSVYRSIDALQKHNLIKQVPIGFKNKFELRDEFKPHHHHATCERCGKSVSIENSEIEDIMNKLTKGAGLKPTRHHFEAYGICRQCDEKSDIKDSR